MLKYITVCILVCLYSISLGMMDLYRGCELVNLANGIEVVFVNTNKTDYACLTLCISNINNQFIEISEIIGRIFQKQVDNEINSNSAIYGTEIYPYYGFEQTLFSIYGKVEHIEQYIKILGKNFSGLSLSEEMISQIKEKMINELKVKNQNDKYNIRNEALSILYHNNVYGKAYSIDNIKKVTNKDIKAFYNRNYSNNKIKLLVTGNIDKRSIEKLLIDCFKNKNSSNLNNQPVKDNYRETNSKLTQFSSQVKVPLIELYWKIPSYKLEPIKAGALDIFCHYLLEELKKVTIHDLKIASSIELEHSFWNFTYGIIKICVILNPNLNIDDAITLLISNIRRITAENKDIEAARNELIVESDVFDYRANVIDTINWVSPKISSGYSFEFLRNYLQLIRSIKKEDIFKEATNLFKKEPNVISILIPKEDKQKNVI